MRWTVIRGNSLQSVPWRNGHGTSRAIVTRLGRDGALLWKVAVADLVADAPFSHYLHADRVFTPLSGDPPVELSFNEGPFEPCPALVPRAFPGEMAVQCRVRAPGQALNLIADRRQCAGEVRILRLEAGDPLEAPDAPDVVIYCVSGELAAAGEQLAPGDALLGPGPAAPGAAAQDSTAVLLAIRPLAATPAAGPR